MISKGKLQVLLRTGMVLNVDYKIGDNLGVYAHTYFRTKLLEMRGKRKLMVT